MEELIPTSSLISTKLTGFIRCDITFIYEISGYYGLSQYIFNFEVKKRTTIYSARLIFSR